MFALYIELTPQNDQTALILAAQRGYSKIFSLLVERGANINATYRPSQSTSPKSLISWMLLWNRWDCAELMLNNENFQVQSKFLFL